jgi:hypothetical protein
MLVEKLELSDPKVKEYRTYFWGGIDAYRVVLTKGRDLKLNPPQADAPLNTFGYPYVRRLTENRSIFMIPRPLSTATPSEKNRAVVNS